MNKKDLINIEEKIELIKNIDNEDCKYLISVFESYKKIIKSDLKESKNKSNENMIGINKDAYLISFDRLYNINKIKKTLSKKNYTKIVALIHIDKVYFGKDWELMLINNFETILNRFNKYEKKDISKTPEVIAKKTIICGKYKENKTNKKGKIKIEKIIKQIIIIKNYSEKINIEFEIKNDSKHLEKNHINKIKKEEIETAIYTMNIKDKKEKLEYTYDKICERIENDLSMYKYCNFENNKCIAQRDKSNKKNYPINEYNGCCYNTEKKEQCNKLKNKKCTIQPIACRLFVCKYLKDRGVAYEVRNSIQTRLFLNIMQKPVIIWSFYMPKEEVIAKLLKWS